MTVIGFDGIAGYVEAHQDEARSLLEKYFDRSKTRDGYTGRYFEYFSERSSPSHLDANDVAACATLSVALPGRVVTALFEQAEQIDRLLSQVPGRDVKLWEVREDELDDAAPLARLYALLRATPGVGKVTASKLLACKRPHLVPVRDKVVERLLGAGATWWRPWRDVVAKQELRDTVERVTPTAVPSETSILRRLDVILWMTGTGA